jgi:hypothetical protein
MSEKTRSTEVRPEAGDGVSGRWVVGVAFAIAVVTACGVGVAWELARSSGPSGEAGRWGQAPDGLQAIEMSLLPRAPMRESSAPAPAHAAREPAARMAGARERLDSYGWSDREHGLVHIPLARAKELLLRRETSERDAELTPVRGEEGKP